jgi:hypothetical protein
LQKISITGESLWRREHNLSSSYFSDEILSIKCLENGNFLITGWSSGTPPYTGGFVYLLDWFFAQKVG